MRTGTGESVDQVVTNSVVAARIRLAVVDVKFAIGSLESGRTGARMRSDQILAGGSVLARRRLAFVDLVLTVTARVAFGALAPVAVADIFAGAAVTTQF